VLNDPSLRGTTFVLVHGGLPFAAAVRYLLGRPNVYTDYSSQGFLTSPRELSIVLRTWLSAFPEKVMFGTDAYPLTTTVEARGNWWDSTTGPTEAGNPGGTGAAISGLKYSVQRLVEGLTRSLFLEEAPALYQSFTGYAVPELVGPIPFDTGAAASAAE